MKTMLFAALLVSASISTQAAEKPKAAELETATFAAGCYWGVEEFFRKIPGVMETKVGFMGGTVPNPKYDDTHDGHTGHAESMQMKFDPKVVSYEFLLDQFFKMHDPTTKNRQGNDEGNQYRSAIFTHNEKQRAAAKAFIEKVNRSKAWKNPVVTEVSDAKQFWPAQEDHQKYLVKNPGGYDNHFLRKISFDSPKGAQWDAKTFKKPSPEELKKKLTAIQFSVTQKADTEPPFKNEFFNNKKEGIYVDVVSGEPLFSSKDKFDSGTGWPSFTRPLSKESLVEKSDRELGIERTEVRSHLANSHLGHVFDDGPPPTGLRYCMNSASLRFIPKENLEKEGYAEFAALFKDSKPAH